VAKSGKFELGLEHDDVPEIDQMSCRVLFCARFSLLYQGGPVKIDPKSLEELTVSAGYVFDTSPVF
jgi:hypothetical protein